MECAAATAKPSYARIDMIRTPAGAGLGAVQLAWHADPAEHREALAEGIRLAAGEEGVELVCLQGELTLVAVFRRNAEADRTLYVSNPNRLRPARPCALPRPMAPEQRHLGRRITLRGAPQTSPRVQHRDRGRPRCTMRLRTRKLHIPVTAGHDEDRYFTPGPAGPDAFHTLRVGSAEFGFRLAGTNGSRSWRGDSLRGAAVLVYPTAIGSEPMTPSSKPATVGEGDRRQRDRQRDVHDRDQPHW